MQPVCARPVRWCIASLLLGVALAAAATVRSADFPAPEDWDVVGRLRVALTAADETLLDIARRNGLGFNEIVAANPDVDPWVPGAGQRILVPGQFVLPPGPRRGIVINLSQMRLFYYRAGTAGGPPRVTTHPIGIGTEYGATPLGSTRVLRKEKDPTWYPPVSIRQARAQEGEILPESVPPGPDNPLGGYALYLGFSGYLIHGTHRPWGIGMRVSAGCIRLYPENIETLYEQVPIGTPVRIIDEPYLVGVRAGVPYLQAFRPPHAASSREDSLTPAVQAVLRAAPGKAIDWDEVLRIAKEKRGVPLSIAARTP